MSAERVKLTEAQTNVLHIASGAPLAKNMFMGQYWRVIDRLEALGLLSRADGGLYKITDLGRAATAGDRS